MKAVAVASLVIIRKRGLVLLGEKKGAEIGTGKLNAPGGKCEQGENIYQCAVREFKEEVDVTIDPKNLEYIGLLHCYEQVDQYGEIQDHPFQTVHVFYSSVALSDEPRETSSMIPKWVSARKLPFDRMHEGDRHWFDQAVARRRFICSVWYKRPGEGYLGHALSILDT